MKNPSKIQFFYVLGIVYFYKKKNFLEALSNFEKFLGQAKDDEEFDLLTG